MYAVSEHDPGVKLHINHHQFYKFSPQHPRSNCKCLLSDPPTTTELPNSLTAQKIFLQNVNIGLSVPDAVRSLFRWLIENMRSDNKADICYNNANQKHLEHQLSLTVSYMAQISFIPLNSFRTLICILISHQPLDVCSTPIDQHLLTST